MRKHRLFALFLALVLALAACGRGPDPEEPAPDPDPEVPFTLSDERLAEAPVITVTEVGGEPAPEGERFDPAAVRRFDPAAVDGSVVVRSELDEQKEGIPYGEGHLVYVNSDEAVQIVLRDMETDESVVVYEGSLEVDSVATTVGGGAVAFAAPLGDDGDLEVFLYDIAGDLLGAPETLVRLTDNEVEDSHVTMSLGDAEEPLKIAWATPLTVGEGDAAQELASYAVGTLEAAGSVDAAELAVFRPEHDAGVLFGNDALAGMNFAYTEPALSGDGSTVIFVENSGLWGEGVEVPAIAPSGPGDDYGVDWFDTIAGDYGRVSLSYEAGYALAEVSEGGSTVVRLIDIGTFVNTDGDEIRVTDLRTLDGDADPFLTAGAESFTYASDGYVYVALASSVSRDRPIRGLDDPGAGTAPYWARSPMNSAAVTWEGAIDQGTFVRPGAPDPVGYRAFEYTPELTAWYEIDSRQTFDGYLLLYEGAFDPENPETNLIAQNDDFDGFFDPERDPPGRSRIVHELEAGTAYVVVTTAYGAESDLAAATFVNTITPGVPQPEPAPEPTELPAPSDGFDITLRFWNDSFDSTQASLFYEAAGRWSEVIIEDVPNIPGFELSAAETAEGAPGLFGELDDVVIDAAIVDIDGPGGTLARAGAYYARSDPFLPTYGIMEFDAAEFEEGGFYSDPAALRAVILHEMGHVLGISRSFWIPNDLLVGNPPDTSFCSDVTSEYSDPRFVGGNAVERWQTTYGGEGNVPVANTGGCGTADSHWREVYLDDELMTGYAAGGTEPLSEVTIGGLDDIGYGVDYAAADPWALPELPRLVQTAPGDEAYQIEVDFGTAFTGSLEGEVEAAVTPVDLALGNDAWPTVPADSTSGCEAADFEGFPAGNIALLQRGACAFGVKAQNALDAGASAVLIANQGSAEDRMGIYSGTFGEDIGIVGVPISYTLGVELAAIDGLRLLVDTDRSAGPALRSQRLHAPIDWSVAEEEVQLRGIVMPDGELRMLDGTD